MRNLYYINSKNERIDFTNSLIVKDASALFGRAWNTDTSYNKIIGFNKKTTNYSFKIEIIDKNAFDIANNILNVAEKDVILQKPGKLYCDDWYINGYIIKSKNTGYSKKSNHISLDLTFITDSVFWNKEDLYVFRINDAGSDATQRGLGYKYDYPFDYLSPISSELLTNENFIDSPAIITIYGPADKPKVIIGGHIYQVKVVLDTQEYLVINGYDKTIVKTTRNGEKINEFANRNKESYIFQKIAPGDNTVIITPECNVDIVLLSERGEPEWI